MFVIWSPINYNVRTLSEYLQQLFVFVTPRYYKLLNIISLIALCNASKKKLFFVGNSKTVKTSKFHFVKYTEKTFISMKKYCSVNNLFEWLNCMVSFTDH